ncbi:MAG: hypothetical protein RIS94_2243, partial [Pseudomonadota bacterium]
MRRSLVLTLALAACSKPAPVPHDAPSAAPVTTPLPPAPPAPSAPTAAARKVSESNDLYDFGYSYPAQAAAIPALKAWLDADLDKAKTQLVADAREGQKDAKDNGFPYHAYEASTDWQVVTDLPGWLSLSALVYNYSGGAHPNHWSAGLLWDKAANTRRDAIDLFTSKPTLKAAILKPFCAALDRARKEKRGDEGWGEGGIDEFTKCIDPLEQVVILGSKGHKGFDRVGF